MRWTMQKFMDLYSSLMIFRSANLICHIYGYISQSTDKRIMKNWFGDVDGITNEI